MTQLEKDQKRTDLLTKQQMLEDELRALEATPVTTYKVWEPEQGKLYSDSSLLETYEYCHNNTYHSTPALAGLAHPTKEAAERHHSFLVMLHDLHKFAVEHNEGWKPKLDDPTQEKFSIYFHIARNQISVSTGFSTCYGALPCFKTGEIGLKAIDTFGDRLKILFEYYNS